MDEATYWSTHTLPMLKKACLDLRLRHHFERIENLVGDGTPDVSYLIAGVAGRIENKFTPRHPVRPTSQVLGSQHGLRRSQVIWNYRHARAGGRVFCLIATPVTAWLIDLRGRSARELTGLGAASTARLGEISSWCADHDSGGTLPLVLMSDTPTGAR